MKAREAMTLQAKFPRFFMPIFFLLLHYIIFFSITRDFFRLNARGSIMLLLHDPRLLARIARWQYY